MIRLILLPTLLICLAMATACTPTRDEAVDRPMPTPPEPSKETMRIEDLTIGFSMDTLQEDRWHKDRTLFKQAVENAGAEVLIEVANGDDAKQVWQTEKMIDKGIDVLVVVPHNAESMAAIVERAHDANIKVLSYDRLVRNAEVDFYISYDNEQVGTLQAEAMTAIVPEGNYVYIGGAETDYNAHLLKKGVFDVLQPYIERGDIRVVFDDWTKDWVLQYAKENMQLALEANLEQIDAVIAGNDATAGAAIETIEKYGLERTIPVAGQDADLAGIKRIVSGTQRFTVYKSIDKLTERAVELAIQLAMGEDIVQDKTINNGKINVPSILLSPVLVNQSNITETVIVDGFHQEADIYGP